jgi:hypothetical protein
VELDVETGVVRIALPDDEPEDESDWAPIDLVEIAGQIRAGTLAPILPEILDVEGGMPLFYKGRVNSVFGESAGGKTWILLAAVAETVRNGERAMFADWEDTPRGMAERLVNLSLTDDEIALVDYRNPTSGLGLGLEQLAASELAEYALIVLDSTGESMASGGINQNDDPEVTMWFRKAKELAAFLGGPAVVVSDHVPKSTEAPSHYAIGSQRKRAAPTGASYRVDTIKEPAKGRDGKLKLTVAKDRLGNRAKGTIAAEVELVSGEGGMLAISLRLPEGATYTADGRWRPTHLMQRASIWIEDHPGCNLRDIRDAVTGSAKHVGDAVAVLVLEGWVEMVNGSNRAQLYTSVKRYRELEDGMRAIANTDPPADEVAF